MSISSLFSVPFYALLPGSQSALKQKYIVHDLMHCVKYETSCPHDISARGEISEHEFVVWFGDCLLTTAHYIFPSCSYNPFY